MTPYITILLITYTALAAAGIPAYFTDPDRHRDAEHWCMAMACLVVVPPFGVAAGMLVIWLMGGM